MKVPDQNNPDSPAITDALLNEEKGNLFEFLVANHLARLNKCENEFYKNLDSQLKSRLSDYEDSINKKDNNLSRKLSDLAMATTLKINEYLQSNNLKLSEIYLIGKMAANFNHNEWHESDIILKMQDGVMIPLSLKLSKENSFMNTKSAGAKSFLEKYFSDFSHSKNYQMELNKEIDQSFAQMAHKLYQMAGIPFSGKFDQAWSEEWSELPGELPSEYREVIYINYHRVADIIHRKLLALQKENSVLFLSELSALCGFGDKKIVQVSCYHQDHSLKSISISKIDYFINENTSAIIEELKPDISAFEIRIKNLILQIRVKPMNKFTTPAYKINCSIKIIKDLR